MPSGNSAVTQYTESFPTAGGEKGDSNHGHRHSASPSGAIGAKNARRLEAKGSEGTAAAEVATETAPSTALTEPASGKAGRSGRPHVAHSAGSPSKPRRNRSILQSVPSSSSGMEEVAAKAFGVGSTGALGFLLPLALLATLIWAVAYVVEHRKRPTV